MRHIWSWQLLTVAVGIIVICPYVNSTKAAPRPPTIIYPQNDVDLVMNLQQTEKLYCQAYGVPPPIITWIRNGKRLENYNNTDIFEYNFSKRTVFSSIIIRNEKFDTFIKYECCAISGKFLTRRSYNVTIKAPRLPIIIEPREDVEREMNRYLSETLYGLANAVPAPVITWRMGEKKLDYSNNDVIFFKYLNYTTVNSTITIKPMINVHNKYECVATSGALETCRSYNLSIKAPRLPIIIEPREDVEREVNPYLSETLYCLANAVPTPVITWRMGEKKLYNSINEVIFLEYLNYTTVNSTITIKPMINVHNKYECVATSGALVTRRSYNLSIKAPRLPIIIEPREDVEREVNPYLSETLYCLANAVPTPVITWRMGEKNLYNSINEVIFMEYLNYTTVNSTITIKPMINVHNKYECVATSGALVTRRSYNLSIKEKSPFKSALYLSVIGVILFFLVLLIIYSMWKIPKEKKLAAAGLLYFKEGLTRSLNPDLGIDEQAELLPYDDRFEYPADKLILGKQLGAGAFGVVYKAEARGIVNADETTTVAVKMVKKTADNMYIKALASELKIMVHLGKHVNIVNLLGACTKNVWKSELIIIVEYCKFGNIHNYMQMHRNFFIDQLTDIKEKNHRENGTFSYSTGSNRMQPNFLRLNHALDVNGAARKGNVQSERESIYGSDYTFEGPTLTSRDLLVWAFQIARGMEYLANRKVLHGDLAARNILLAEDNIVKICDFGLARNIYKNDEYKKKEDCLLPVKWVAIECMTDRIFSTQSDVWSFGIVLWELFSLAKNPYPNISPTSLLRWLSDGHRLDKPQYANNKLHDVMLHCWQQKPTARPTFGQLQEILGSFLEDNVRRHYVDLNTACMAMNAKNEGVEDYLAMMSAPDYTNMVTPRPHRNVLKAKSPISPTPTNHRDDGGYLQMSPHKQSIFSAQGSGVQRYVNSD